MRPLFEEMFEPEPGDPRYFGIGAGPTERRPGEIAARFVVLLVLSVVQLIDVTKIRSPDMRLPAIVVASLCLAGCVSWVVGWILPQRRAQYLALSGLLVVGTGGALLTGLLEKDLGVAPALPAIATAVVAVRWPPMRAAVVLGWFVLVLLVAAATQGTHQLTSNGIGYGSLLIGMYGLGASRRSNILRAQGAEKLVKETERANHEEAHAAALAERSRIAREIHDVLAHSLAALTVQLEAADALLEAGGEQSVTKAHDYVAKSRRIAREGLVETRRAIAALREDAPPIPQLLNALTEAYRADTGAAADVRISGLPRPLQADAGLTVYRAAQESLTNIRKHAPGAPVWLTLVYGAGEIVLTVANGAPTAPRTALHESGGGYGLAGLKERAELIGGSLEAGPWAGDGAGDGDGDGVAPDEAGVAEGPGGWRVRVRLPG